MASRSQRLINRRPSKSRVVSQARDQSQDRRGKLGDEGGASMSPEKQRIAIGRDCCGKEIIPILGRKLEVKTNRHTTTDGYLWGWIEGTTSNTVWGDDNKFNHAAAVTLVRDYNAESSAKHEDNTTKSVSPTSAATEDSSATDHFRDATKMVSGESSAQTPTQPQ